MAELYGYTGKIAFVDLSTGEITQLDTANYTDFLGGRGIGAKINWDFVGPDVKGCDPENVISFITSPTMGTPCPGGQKTMVSGVAPHMYPVESFLKKRHGRHVWPRAQVCGLGRRVRDRCGREPRLPAHRGRQGRDSRRERPLGARHPVDPAPALGPL